MSLCLPMILPLPNCVIKSQCPRTKFLEMGDNLFIVPGIDEKVDTGKIGEWKDSSKDQPGKNNLFTFSWIMLSL